jgi:uncharacterized protein (TIGR00369 family)
MTHWGMDFVTAIKAGRSPFPPPAWMTHLGLAGTDAYVIDTAAPGRVVSIWTPVAHFTVPDGFVLGGLITAVADGAHMLALMTLSETPQNWVTTDFHTRFVRAVRAGETVRIDTEVVNRGRSSAIVEARFTLAGDKLAAIVTGAWRAVDMERRAL